jgi:small-conductance mechanosensitive channel
MNGLAAALGMTAHEAAAAGTALLIVAATAAAAWVIGRRSGIHIVDAWERVAGTRVEEMVPRLCALVRYFLIWLVLALVIRLEPWPVTAAFILGLAAAAAAALFVKHVVRGLNLSRWIAWPLAGFLFVAILADAVGGLAQITAPLDRLAFSVGSRRLSLLNVIQIVVALIALYAVVRLAIRLFGQAIKGARSLDPTQQLLTEKLAAIAIIAVAFFVAVDLAGIDLTALAVFSGALGLAVGFGLQKTFGNLIAGIILLMDRSIKPGDVISVGESFGSVNKIGVRAVSIVTRDGKEYLIPNEILMTEEVVNWSYSTRDVRISIPVPIAYDCDVKLAHRLMIEAATAAERVLETPRPNVWITAFGESAIEHEIRVWIEDPEAGIGSIRSEILNRLWELFNEHRIKVPSPQHEIRVKSWPNPPGNGEGDRA